MHQLTAAEIEAAEVHRQKVKEQRTPRGQHGQHTLMRPQSYEAYLSKRSTTERVQGSASTSDVRKLSSSSTRTQQHKNNSTVHDDSMHHDINKQKSSDRSPSELPVMVSSGTQNDPFTLPQDPDYNHSIDMIPELRHQQQHAEVENTSMTKDLSSSLHDKPFGDVNKKHHIQMIHQNLYQRHTSGKSNESSSIMSLSNPASPLIDASKRRHLTTTNLRFNSAEHADDSRERADDDYKSEMDVNEASSAQLDASFHMMKMNQSWGDLVSAPAIIEPKKKQSRKAFAISPLTVPQEATEVNTVTEPGQNDHHQGNKKIESSNNEIHCRSLSVNSESAKNHQSKRLSRCSSAASRTSNATSVNAPSLSSSPHPRSRTPMLHTVKNYRRSNTVSSGMASSKRGGRSLDSSSATTTLDRSRTPDDVATVMEVTLCSKKAAQATLRQHNGNVSLAVNAVCDSDLPMATKRPSPGNRNSNNASQLLSRSDGGVGASANRNTASNEENSPAKKKKKDTVADSIRNARRGSQRRPSDAPLLPIGRSTTTKELRKRSIMTDSSSSDAISLATKYKREVQPPPASLYRVHSGTTSNKTTQQSVSSSSHHQQLNNSSTTDALTLMVYTSGGSRTAATPTPNRRRPSMTSNRMTPTAATPVPATVASNGRGETPTIAARRTTTPMKAGGVATGHSQLMQRSRNTTPMSRHVTPQGRRPLTQPKRQQPPLPVPNKHVVPSSNGSSGGGFVVFSSSSRPPGF